MTKIRFQGFPEGSTVSLSVTQGGVTRGPLTVSAWKQSLPQPSGNVTFKVYSPQGTDETDTSALASRRIHQGDVIEMPAPGSLSLIYRDITGTSTSDQRRLTFLTDFGERYDAQHLTHEYLPADVRAAGGTLDPTGAQLGIYPGYVCGHAFRGVDMSGNSILTPDTINPDGPVGTVDKTVTCTVSDGVNTGVLTFTVRLIHPLRYYRDVNGATYAPALGGNRGGVYYVTTDGNFTGAPAAIGGAGGIYHKTLSGGNWENADFDRTKQIAIFFKGGQTFYPTERLRIQGAGASMMASWGTGKAIISGAKQSLFTNVPQELFWDGLGPSEVAPLRPYRVSNLDFHGSDYDVSDPEWREWWNVLNYTGKTFSGKFVENTQGNLNPTVDGAPINGELLTGNAVEGGTANTRIIRDDDNGDGTGTLITRQIAFQGEPRTFADGETLTGVSGSITFVAAGSRQDRTKKCPPVCFFIVPGTANFVGFMIDDCTFRGFAQAYAGYNRWPLISDTLVRDWWNYGIGETVSEGMVINGTCVALPSSYQGEISTFSESSVDPNRNTFNSVRTDNPTTPVPNNVRHAALRVQGGRQVGLYKLVGHNYGGHGGSHQSFIRGPALTYTAEGTAEVYQHGCTYSGGGGFGPEAENAATPRAYVMDQCWLRADFCTSFDMMLRMPVTNVGIRNSKFEWPEGNVIGGGRPFGLIRWDGDTPSPTTDANWVRCFVEDCEFIYRSGNTWTQLLPFDTTIRGITDMCRYVGNTVTVADPAKFNNNVPSFPDIP